MKLLMGLLFFCCTLSWAGTVPAKMYKWVDKNGVLHFSGTPVFNEGDNVDLQTMGSRSSTSGNYGISDQWFDEDQLIKVEFNKENLRQCRLTSAELSGQTMMFPTGCSYKR